VVRLGVLLILATVPLAAWVVATPAELPTPALTDQEGRELDWALLRGRVVVVVYGTRHGVEQHVAWGRQLERAMIERGVYRAEDPPRVRQVRILALAQMGGIPSAFRGAVRAVVRSGTPGDFSLWLDWEDRMSTAFGVNDVFSTVVVADRAGRVRLVRTGEPTDAALAAVVAAVLGIV